MFGQIERGLTVEFRAEPEEGKDDSEEQKALKDISEIARVIQFPKVTQEPMLLNGSEILEGDIHVKHTKKTTTHKSTVTKKAEPKEAEPTPKQ